VLLEPEPLTGRALEVRPPGHETESTASPSRIVITPAEVRESGAATAAEVLERHGGVDILRQGAQAKVTIRGSRPEAVQVLVDGVAMNPSGGAADLASIPASTIERIEVVQGPAAADGGVDALAGAVLIHTRPPARQRTIALFAGFGSFAQRATSLQLDGLGYGSQRIRLGWQNDLTDGSFTYDDPQLGANSERLNNEAHRQNFVAQGSGTLSSTWRWGGSASYYRLRAGVPGPEFQLTPLAGRREKRYVYTGRLDRQGPHGQLQLSYSHTRDWNHYANDGVLPYRSETEAALHSARASYTLEESPAQGAGLALEYIYERLAGDDLLNPAYSFGQARRDHYAAALRYARAFAIHTSHLRELGVNLGARVDQSETEGNHPQAPGQIAVDSLPKVWRTVNPHAQLTLAGDVAPISWSCFAGYSRSFRRPPLIEQFWEESYRTRGNPALLPERAGQFETGYGLTFDRRLSVSWQQQFYFTRYRDLIYWRAGQGGVFSPSNIGRAQVDGREDELRISALARLAELTLRHQYQDHRNTAGEPNTDDQPLPFRYRHKTQVAISSRIKWGRVELARRWYDRRYLREAGTASKSLDPYAVTDLTAGLRLTARGLKGDLSFGILNLGNTRYETVEREPMPGRSYHVNLQLEI